MCGIVGSSGQKISKDWIRGSLIEMSHRGPDSSGYYDFPNHLRMGAVRLAMTDPLPRSNQPFLDEASGDSLTFNGEIFNFLNLRDELESLGHTFETESDTEVLLNWLQEFGIGKLGSLEGMFSFAYFRNSENKLTLARDTLGKKPLYFYNNSVDGTFAWSSSLNCLKSLQTSPKLNGEALADYLALGYVLDPISIYEKIESVNPGEVIEINLSDGTHKRIKFARNSSASGVSNLRKTLTKAVLDRIHGHQQVALSLSGGLDSAIIAVILAENSINARCYSASWLDSDKAKYNLDAFHARKIAKNLGLDFKEIPMIAASNLESELIKFLKAMEEPNNNPTGVSMMKLYKEIASDGNRLVLTGDGADEVFAGYERYLKSDSLINILNFKGKFLRSQTLRDRRFLNLNISSFLETQISPKCVDSWVYWHALFNESEIEELSKLSITGNRDRINKLSAVHHSAKLVESVMQRDREIWLPMESNRKLDRISMHYSIEARSPFQDENIIEFGKESMKLQEFKNLRKENLRAAFPEVDRIGVRTDKAGFISPIGHWLRNNPTLIAKSMDTLIYSRLFDPTIKDKMKSVPYQGDFNSLKKLWSLVVLGVWIELSLYNEKSIEL